jgi:hypothetical protein
MQEMIRHTIKEGHVQLPIGYAIYNMQYALWNMQNANAIALCNLQKPLIEFLISNVFSNIHNLYF